LPRPLILNPRRFGRKVARRGSKKVPMKIEILDPRLVDKDRPLKAFVDVRLDRIILNRFAEEVGKGNSGSE
jgi:hypothetical protein